MDNLTVAGAVASERTPVVVAVCLIAPIIVAKIEYSKNKKI